jgi:hypothetical protein
MRHRRDPRPSSSSTHSQQRREHLPTLPTEAGRRTTRGQPAAVPRRARRMARSQPRARPRLYPSPSSRAARRSPRGLRRRLRLLRRAHPRLPHPRPHRRRRNRSPQGDLGQGLQRRSSGSASLPVTESFAGTATGLTGSRATVRIDRLADGTFAWPEGPPHLRPRRPAHGRRERPGAQHGGAEPPSSATRRRPPPASAPPTSGRARTAELQGRPSAAGGAATCVAIRPCHQAGSRGQRADTRTGRCSRPSTTAAIRSRTRR